MAEIIFITNEGRPDISSSDRLVAAELAELGFSVKGVPWGQKADAYAGAVAIILRSNWDYPLRPDAFKTWLRSLDGLPVFNSPALVRWNLDKTYLHDLAAAGIRTPCTIELLADSDPLRIMKDLSLSEAVIKPACGASGALVQKVDRHSARNWRQEVPAGYAERRFLFQEMVPEIAAGEISMAFFDLEFSHAVLKAPATGEFRTNSRFKGQVRRTRPAPEIIDQARAALDALPEPPLYARVDGVQRSDGFCLFELEVNEPSFYFAEAPDAARNFATAIAGRL